MDFIIKNYIALIKTLKIMGYSFQTFEDFIKNPKNKVVIMRHDVDKSPQQSLRLANLEYKLGVKSSYYFRIVKKSNDPDIIKTVANLGHEIGYHYEDLSVAKGNIQKTIEKFKNNLDYFRQFYPVNTICMHGSPLSKWDNRLLWKEYNYRDFGIIGEPYFDVDYNKVLYITDTGRKWNNQDANIRDKVRSKFTINIKSTHHFLQLISQNKLPNQIIINTHPQRWSNFGFNWLKELFFQTIKNQIKKIINYRRNN